MISGQSKSFAKCQIYLKVQLQVKKKAGKELITSETSNKHLKQCNIITLMED